MFFVAPPTMVVKSTTEESYAAYYEGKKAFKLGKSINDNPYKESHKSRAWDQGWTTAYAEK